MSIFDIEKINEFYNAYVSAGLLDSSNAKFLKSVLDKRTPPKGRGLDWLEDIFNKGIPQEPSEEDREFSNHLLDISKKLQHEEEQNTLREFSKKILTRQQLTENQRKYMGILIEKANSGFRLVEVDKSVRDFIKALEGKIKHGVSGYYWNSRPGTYRRALAIFDRFSARNEMSDNDIKFLREIFSSWTTVWDTAESLIGRLLYYKDEPVLVIGNKCSTSDGTILIDVIYEGSTSSVNVSSLRKRTKQMKK
jgi:hypothetical protein